MVNTKKESALWVSSLGFGLFLFLLAGCVQRYTTTESFLDTPHHHVVSGFKLLENDRTEDAEREFRLAVQLDASYARAYCGLALVAGKKGDFSRAFESMDLAKSLAKTEEERATIQVGYMRLYTMQKGRRWLENVQASFHNAVIGKKDLPEAYFHLGIAYKDAFRFLESEKAFRKAMGGHSPLVLKADRALEIVRMVVNASPGSMAGKRIAIKDRITRADAAALVIEELKLDRMRESAVPKRPQDVSIGFQDSRKSIRSVVPSDAKCHPLISDIEAALRLNINGLRIYPDGTFRPERHISRAEYAEIMSDIIVTVRNDPTLMARFSRRPGPFSDITNNEPYFNAVMLCTAGAGIMGPKRGIFNPEGGVSGAEALLIIRKLKDELKID